MEIREINVLEYGADNTGEKDNTELLQSVHSTGNKIFYPNGIYLFNGRTLDLSGGVRFESFENVVIRNSLSELSILNFDNQGNLVGLMQNHLQIKDVLIKNGSLVSPPLSLKKIRPKVTLMPYWYNDFGLTCQNGWSGWQTWEWNYQGLTGKNEIEDYDSSRHPLLGYYYGDDPVTLDWISYWLYEHGVQATILIAEGLCNWERKDTQDHWVNVLLNDVPNFKNLKYVITASSVFGKNADINKLEEKTKTQWKSIVDKIYTKFDNYFYIVKNNKKYPVVSIWEERALPLIFDRNGGVERTREALLYLRDLFRDAGFEGVCLFSRSPVAEFTTKEGRDYFSTQGIIRYDATYVANYVPDGFLSGKYSYKDVVDLFSPLHDPYTLMGIATSVFTHHPHGSAWKCNGSNPHDFERWLRKAVDHLEEHEDMLKVITCYNVSEWAEGGTGLQPTVKDNFLYLEAVKNVLLE